MVMGVDDRTGINLPTRISLMLPSRRESRYRTKRIRDLQRGSIA